MGLHVAVNDYGLQHHHEGTYVGLGQWMLAGALVTGAVVGYVVDLGPLARDVIFSFLSGGIVLNVVKEEVPEERRGHFPAFAGGAALYAALLLLI